MTVYFILSINLRHKYTFLYYIPIYANKLLELINTCTALCIFGYGIFKLLNSIYLNNDTKMKY